MGFQQCKYSNAWNTAQGEGIKIGVVGCGISSSQTLLGSQFTDGMSNNNRTITTDYKKWKLHTQAAHMELPWQGISLPVHAMFKNATTGVAYKQVCILFVRR